MARRLTEMDKKIGNRLIKLRHSRKITQQKLGEHLGVTFQQIQKYENGTNRISSGSLYRTAQFMGVSILYFFQDLEQIQTKPDLPKKMYALMYDLHRIKNEKIKKSISNLIKAMNGL